MPPHSDARNQGVVLVLVLVLLLSLTGIILATLSNSSKGALESATLPPEYQADLLAESALPMAIEILNQDMDPTADTLQEPWARPYVSDNLVIRITPANAYLPINLIKAIETKNSTTAKSASLVDTTLDKGQGFSPSDSKNTLTPTQKEEAKAPDQSKADTASARSLYRLEFAMQTLLAQVPDNLLMIENARDWVHNSTYALAKLPLYAQKQPPYTPRFKPFVIPEEMLLVAGWEKMSPPFIRSSFNVWGSGAKININFAPVEILSAYLPELRRYLDSIILWRERRGFTHISQLLSATTLTADSEAYTSALSFLTVSSDLFQVEVEAKASGCLIRKRYILGRNPLNPDEKPSLLTQNHLETLLDLQ